MDTRRTGALLMVGAILQLVLFAYGLVRRSYAALAIPVALAVAGLSALGAWVGYTMLTIEEDMPEPELDNPAGATESLTSDASPSVSA